jgi:hypothetical protein
VNTIWYYIKPVEIPMIFRNKKNVKVEGHEDVEMSLKKSLNLEW